MRPSLFAPCLCFLMTTSLFAQETAAVATIAVQPPVVESHAATPTLVKLKPGTEVDLALLDPVSSATAVKGQPVKFVVAKDVIAEGLVVIPTGTPATGIVRAVRKGAKGKHNGYVVLQPQTVALADGTMLTLKEYPPGEPTCGNLGPCFGLVAAVVLLAPIWAPIIGLGMLIALPWMIPYWTKEKKPEVAGTDEVKEACQHTTMYTGAEFKIPANATEASQPPAPKESMDLGQCPASSQSSKAR